MFFDGHSTLNSKFGIPDKIPDTYIAWLMSPLTTNHPGGTRPHLLGVVCVPDAERISSTPPSPRFLCCLRPLDQFRTTWTNSRRRRRWISGPPFSSAKTRRTQRTASTEGRCRFRPTRVPQCQCPLVACANPRSNVPNQCLNCIPIH